MALKIEIKNTDFLSKTIKDLEPKLQRTIKRALEKEINKPTPAQEKEFKNLQRQLLRLWRHDVIKRAGKQCEAIEPNGKRCKKTKRLNAHHIESYSTNKWLRFDRRNGGCFCSRHHKFGRLSAHKSFCFMYLFMLLNREDDLQYLLFNYNKKQEITKEFLLNQIKSDSPKLIKRRKQNELLGK